MPTPSDVSASPSGAGRYAPSPSGDLHLGNLRTALYAWLFARSTGRAFRLRIEDLDRVREGSAQRQMDDLEALGIDWDGEPLIQSARTVAYEDAVARLRERGMVYECFCTRREIQEASSAPHGAPGAYPGTCRTLTADERTERARSRPAALRLRSETREWTVLDRYAGQYTGMVDDMVLVRNDGRAAYNLAVVVDDHFQGIDQVVRGDDLLSSAPRQSCLASLLGLGRVDYVHVPLALNREGKRLAKRDGAVTVAELRDNGVAPAEIVRMIASSMPLRSLRTDDAGALPESASQMLEVFDPETISLDPWTVLEPAAEVPRVSD